jgi:hypothetical protein
MFHGIVYTYFMHQNIFTHTSVDTEDILMFGYKKITITHKTLELFYKYK